MSADDERTLRLFDPPSRVEPAKEDLGPGAVILRHFAVSDETALVAAVSEVTAQAPFRHMITPGGFRMSVAITNCGSLGWVTDRTGYRYDPIDPESGRPWPAMPRCFLDLARSAAQEAGFSGFVPDACLINRYQAGAKLSLHQDKDERDLTAPIVSVSLGVPALFLFGGLKRAERPKRLALEHGDVVVWGGAARLRYHGVVQLQEGRNHLLGGQRVNLTFRKAG